jgi:hypothetical protein
VDVIPVTCNNCGAALQVPESARFVTCRYCNSQLQIKRTDTAVTTEVLEQINQNAAAMVDDLHVLRRDAEVERLDREWREQQSRLMIKDRYGNTTMPTATGGLIGAVILGGGGILWTIMAYYITAPHEMPGFPSMPGQGFPGMPIGGDPAFSIAHTVFPLFGVLVVIAGVAMGIKTALAASQLDEERRIYERRRQQLLDQQPAGSHKPTDSNIAS